MWSSLRGKGGPRSSSDPEPTTTKTAPAKRTKRLVKKTSHMRRNPHVNSTSADHVDGKKIILFFNVLLHVPTGLQRSSYGQHFKKL